MISKQQFNELKRFVQEQMLELGVPGAVVGVLDGDETHIASFGVTNVNHPLAVTADTIFQIGSNTKTFTGTLIMMLVEEGLVDLDRPVADYLPDFRVRDPEASQKARVRHLLSHTAGWVGDLFEDTGSGADAKQKYIELMADLEQLAPFGHHFSYNNAAFAVAGRLIEVVTGKMYEQVIKERIFEPLGMDHSFFAADDVMIHRFAVGHNNFSEQPTVGHQWSLPRACYSMGAIACTATDLFQYARLYLNGGKNEAGEQLLSPDSIKQLWSDGTEIDAAAGRMGLSWFQRDVAGVRTHRHGGATVGQLSEFVIIPAHNFAYLVFTNADSGRQLNAAVSAWILEHVFDAKAPSPEPQPVSEEMLRSYVGTYSRPMVDIEVDMRDGELGGVIKTKQGFPTKDSPPRPPSPRFKLGVLPDGDLWVLDGAMKDNRGHIIRTPDGKIDYLRVGLRLHKKQ